MANQLISVNSTKHERLNEIILLDMTSFTNSFVLAEGFIAISLSLRHGTAFFYRNVYAQFM